MDKEEKKLVKKEREIEKLKQKMKEQENKHKRDLERKKDEMKEQEAKVKELLKEISALNQDRERLAIQKEEALLLPSKVFYSFKTATTART